MSNSRDDTSQGSVIPGQSNTERGEPKEQEVSRRGNSVHGEFLVQKVHFGPLPDAELLREYEELFPGSAEIIFKNFDAQSKHRRKMEASSLEHSQKRSWRGQTLGFILALASLGTVVVMVMYGASLAAGTTMVAAIASLAGTFVYGRKSQVRDLKRKRDAVAPPHNDSDQHGV